MANHLSEALAVFDGNVASVKQLMSFDRDVLELAIAEIRSLRENLKKSGFDAPALSAMKTLQVLEQIRQNDSLRGRYETIFNQALVLLVSYFGSALADIFKLAMMKTVEERDDPKILREVLRLTVKEIRDYDFDLQEGLADLFVEKHDISFQDMQSISRAFRDYVGVEPPPQDKTVNNIILAQAARHVIVHAAGVVNGRMLRQVSSAKPRDLKLHLELDGRIQFQPDEVEAVAESMRRYADDLGHRLSRELDFGNDD